LSIDGSFLFFFAKKIEKSQQLTIFADGYAFTRLLKN